MKASPRAKEIPGKTIRDISRVVLSTEAEAAYPLAGDGTLPPQPKHFPTKEEVWDEQALRNLDPNEPSKLVHLDPNRPEAIARIRSEMTQETCNALTQHLVKHQNIFARGHKDKPGIAPEII